MGPSAGSDAFKTELDVLRTMCQGTQERRVCADGVRLLAGYAFSDPIHQVVFEALCELGADDPATIRESLPRRLTVKGFPDVDLAPFFTPHSIPASQAIALMELLRAKGSGRRSESTRS